MEELSSPDIDRPQTFWKQVSIDYYLMVDALTLVGIFTVICNKLFGEQLTIKESRFFHHASDRKLSLLFMVG